MNHRTWVILGATSQIAQEFAYLAAQAHHSVVLVARDSRQLAVMSADIRLRYHIPCETIVCDFSADFQPLLNYINHNQNEMDLFIGQGLMINNGQLNPEKITSLMRVNVECSIQTIHTYWKKTQTYHHIIFLSSVAGLRGRAKNSLYGASKRAVEIYLQGLQHAALKTQHITIARLGFIDTKLTFGEPNIFYAASPQTCAQACWQALISKKSCFYFPFFWRYIMIMIRYLPFFIYKRMRI